MVQPPLKQARLFIVRLLMITLFIGPATVHSDSIQAKEYYLKAAFLYNFARLVEWPENTFATDTDPIRICLMGNDSFGDALHTLHNKKVLQRTLVIQTHVNLQQLSSCHMLFIDKSEKNNLHTIISSLRKHSILSVSELPFFAQKNGHIRLFLNQENTLSLEINLKAIKYSGLNISSRILTLAKIVSSNEVSDQK